MAKDKQGKFIFAEELTVYYFNGLIQFCPPIAGIEYQSQTYRLKPPPITDEQAETYFDRDRADDPET